MEKSTEQIFEALRSSKTDGQKVSSLMYDLSKAASSGHFQIDSCEPLARFFSARKESTKEYVALVFREMPKPVEDIPDVLKSAISSEKNADILQRFFMVLGRYPSEVSYLEEQLAVQRKPAAKAGILSALEMILGYAGRPIYARLVREKKLAGGYWIRSLAAQSIMEYGGSEDAPLIAGFVRDIIGMQRDMGPGSVLVRAIRFLHENFPPTDVAAKDRLRARRREEQDEAKREALFEEIMSDSPEQAEVFEAFRAVQTCWPYVESISDEEQLYLKEQYDWFFNLPLRSTPKVHDLEWLEKALDESGLPRRATVQQCREALAARQSGGASSPS